MPCNSDAKPLLEHASCRHCIAIIFLHTHHAGLHPTKSHTTSTSEHLCSMPEIVMDLLSLRFKPATTPHMVHSAATDALLS